MVVSNSTSSTSYRCVDARFRELLEDHRQYGNCAGPAGNLRFGDNTAIVLITGLADD
jgi:hypothetical protein